MSKTMSNAHKRRIKSRVKKFVKLLQKDKELFLVELRKYLESVVNELYRRAYRMLDPEVPPAFRLVEDLKFEMKLLMEAAYSIGESGAADEAICCYEAIKNEYGRAIAMIINPRLYPGKI